ncbi:MAG: hypothetical protein RKE49_09060 [Oceanicaulis sp.]
MDEPILRRQRYSARYGARDPWLAGGARAGLYLVWRALFAAWRPAIFAALLIGAAAFGWRGLDGAAPWLARATPDGVSERAETMLGDARSWWEQAVSLSLNPGPGRAPDLVLAESLSPLLPELYGQDHLARSLLLEEGRTERRLEAVLRAQPAWRREALYTQTLEARLEAGRGRPGLAAELVFADERTVARLQRARALYGPALEQVETWFSDPAGRTLSLRAVPGLDAAPPRAALHGDVRDVIVQGCALAEQSGRRVPQCRVVFLPKPPGDLLQAALALAVVDSEGQARIGARIFKAAAAAGFADEPHVSRLVLGRDDRLAREAVLASAMTLMSEAGERYTRPVYSQTDAAGAGADFTRSVTGDAAERDRVFAHMAAVRRETGAIAAVRLAGLVRSEQDAARLAALADRHGPALLGLHAALGPAVMEIDARAGPASWPAGVEARRDLALAAGLAGLALALLAWVIGAGWRRARGGPPGLVERTDAAVTRLILGRNP